MSASVAPSSPNRPLRLAFVGKGGAGKSAIAATFARLLGRSGDQPVVALDSDPMPGLALSLGIPVRDAGIPDEAVVEMPEDEDGPRFRLRDGPEQAIETYAAHAPDGVRFLQIGKLRGHAVSIARSQHAFHQIKTELPRDRWHVIGDLPGGTRQPFLGWADFADTIVIVVEPTAKGILSGRRLANLAGGVVDGERLFAVVNKTRSERDGPEIAARTGLPVIAAIPWDADVAEAERHGLAPLDAAPDGPAVRAIATLQRAWSEGCR